MSFYNRLLAQAVEKFVDLQGKVEPLDVVMYGGLNHASSVFAGGGAAVLLPAPAAGFVYRLQRIIVTAGVGFLTGTTSGVIYAIAQNQTTVAPDNCMGQLVNEGITANATAALTLYMTYDLITTPSIS